MVERRLKETWGEWGNGGGGGGGGGGSGEMTEGNLTCHTQVENSGRVVVGTNPTDGVYETTLTGGISPLSRSLGLVSDNLLSAQVVLADGRLATVSAAGATIEGSDGETLTYDSPELFNALRGGGFNWAIPVSFTFRLHFPPFQVSGYIATRVQGQRRKLLTNRVPCFAKKRNFPTLDEHSAVELFD